MIILREGIIVCLSQNVIEITTDDNPAVLFIFVKDYYFTTFVKTFVYYFV